MTGGENPDPILQRVRVLIDNKRYDEAMLDLSLAPESAAVRNLMGVVALKRRRFKEAEQHLRRALELEPQNYEVINNLGLAVSRRRGRRREAIDLFTRAAELHPGAGAAESNLHDTAHRWLYSAGLVGSWVIFRMVRTAWMAEGWQGMWNPWVIAAASALTVAVACLVILRRRRALPERARLLVDRQAAVTRRARQRNAVFDGILFAVFFGGMFRAIQVYEPLQHSMGLRALMFLALLGVGLSLAGLFRRITGSPPEA